MTVPAFIILNWTLTAVLSVFVALRFYTRIRYVSKYGLDDLFYGGAFIFYLAVAICQQIAVVDGLGQYGSGVSHNSKVSANILFMVGDTGQAMAEALSKASAGFFLLRLVFQRWQRILIVATSVVFAALCVAGIVIEWTSCRPLPAGWDYRIKGTCSNETAIPIVYCVCVDLLFAAMPWGLVWNNSRPTFEKLLIGGPLSLGIVAAGTGVGRLVATYRSDLHDVTIQSSMWSMGEIFSTLVGVGVPATLPVWRAVYHKCWGQRRAESRMSSYHVLGQYTIGGSAVLGATMNTSHPGSTRHSSIHRLKLKPCMLKLACPSAGRDEAEAVEKRAPKP